jgi:hypothetical protein
MDNYKITYSHTTWTRTVDGASVVDDFVSHANCYKRSSLEFLEVKVGLLTELVGRIPDQLGINLLDVIDAGELTEQYTFVTSADT